MTESPLNHFLTSVQARAYRMARLATREDDEALDIVQEAMIKLARHYGDRDAEQWRPLFFRILENQIMDWHRREALRRRWFFWRADRQGEKQEPVPEPSDEGSCDPEAALMGERMSETVLAEIEAMPVRQQQCFLLRHWEGLSVQQTADIMGIDSGSVKTHSHRALQKLNRVIGQHSHG